MTRIVSLAQETPAERARIGEVWEASVRATHDFLSAADLADLIPLATDALRQLSPIYCVRDAAGTIVAFMFVEHAKIEALFVDPAHRGRGAGRALVEHALRELGARTVDVNEQNPLAIGFYERLGFRAVGRSPRDGQGKPFPILHMELDAGAEGRR